MPPIHHTFGPLANHTDALLALGSLLCPWRWQQGPAIDALAQSMVTRMNAGQDGSSAIFLWSSGREALCAALRALDPLPGDEVIVQGYTCIVVPNAIRAANMTPVFVDIDPDTLSLDPEAVTQAITPKTRAILCQHTFGIPAPLDTLKEICTQRSILLIEDCAHILPDETGPEEIGQIGHMAFWSFGRDKAISGITGGALLVQDETWAAAVQRQAAHADTLSRSTVIRLLLYPLLYTFCRPLYELWIGKAILAFAGKIRLLVPILTPEEKRGSMPHNLTTMPNACAALALKQLRSLRAMNDHRRMLTRFYLEEIKRRKWQQASSPDDALHPYVPKGITPDLPLQKFPLFVPHAEHIRQQLKKKYIYLHDGWTGCVICPPSVDPSVTGYRDGDDPKAELCGSQILSLPTHPNMTIQQANYLMETIGELLEESFAIQKRITN